MNDIMLKYHTPFLQENILAGVDIINAENLSPEQIAKHIIGECESAYLLYDL